MKPTRCVVAAHIFAGSQEVLACTASARRHSPPVVRHGRENGKVGLEVFAERHDGRDVATAVTIVWSRPYGHDILILKVVLRVCISVVFGQEAECQVTASTLYPSLTS